MFKILLLVCMVTISVALRKDEIEQIRRELNGELTKLEIDNYVKKTVDTKKDVKEDALFDLLSGEESKKEDTEFAKKFRSALNQQLTKKSADTEESVLKLLLQDGNDKRNMPEPEKEECVDTRTDCKSYAPYCASPEYKERMSKLCPKTCKACKVCIKDKLPKDRCELAKKSGFCENQRFAEQMKTYCYETCGHCRVAAPPACQNDPEGCCWHDGTTFVKDGCPACENSPNVMRLCQTLSDECTNQYAPGKWMKKYCPITCKFCDPKKECHDDFTYRQQCKNWKEENKCDDKDVKKICPRSCNACSQIHNNWK